MALEIYKHPGNCNSQRVKETTNHANHSDRAEKKPLNGIPQFHSPNRFDAWQIIRGDGDHNSAVGSRRSKANQLYDH